MTMDHDQVRQEIVRYLLRDQFGPYGERQETLPENPLRRYMVGVLNPRDTAIDATQNDGGLASEPVSRSNDSEPGLQLSSINAPSSFGLTFACRQNVEKIRVFVNCAKYNPKNASESGTGGEEWQREEIAFKDEVAVDSPGDHRIDILQGELSLRLRVRRPKKNQSRALTISAVNEHYLAANATFREKGEKSFFQVHFGAEAIDDDAPFLPLSDPASDGSISEENGVRLLYREVFSYVKGHGCAANWEERPDESRSFRVESSFLPSEVVYPLKQPADLNLPKFSVKKIAETSQAGISFLFSNITTEYDNWIAEKENTLAALPDHLQAQGREHLEQCRVAAGRIRQGISLLQQDNDVYQAFVLMHRAMLHQISRSIWFKQGKPGSGPQTSDEYAWYPFQLAFILQCLESLANRNSSDRGIVDLLWFPTGGGKTEAYLGIIAFVAFLRRVRSLSNHEEPDGGTVALMRYTLRLLTVDQFFRAALLACSCEKIRREDRAGLQNTEPISIGLWVGGEASPNRWQDARRALEDINNGAAEPTAGNPLKLRVCPWCGAEIGSADYSIPSETSPMLISCPDDTCAFHTGLPVWVTDTDVYRKRPTLIIGTVDKFARIPWVEDAGRLFSQEVDGGPPEVIIQDELHLISGPLGTMVGLYETAVDALCGSIGGTRPKVIASTATIRNADSQVRSLFDRTVSQFPPPGLEYSDSFFAREDRNQPGRMYIGVFTPGTSQTTALIRTFAILLHAAKQIQCDDNVRDAYWTLMAYFNSLRELGSASVQVNDDVNDYLEICAERDGDRTSLRQVSNKAELTGRVDSTELEGIRDNLWRRFPDPDCPDVVLATNMISVGLDVPRLGLMSIVGQPKSTSEYIQASSRIGRGNPGLVVTIYNWVRSRDRSHYERFREYHSRLYSEVEATSVTPFASRARDRGLHAVLISMVRHLIAGMAGETSAAGVNDIIGEIRPLVDFILKRVEKIDPSERSATEQAIEDIITKWVNRARDTELVYSRSARSRATSVALMVAPESISKSPGSFPTLNSLRNIDPAAGLGLES